MDSLVHLIDSAKCLYGFHNGPYRSYSDLHRFSKCPDGFYKGHYRFSEEPYGFNRRTDHGLENETWSPIPSETDFKSARNHKGPA